ncbi:hypothetical protein O6H91_04G140300 [Diphasiastrum complanatum]|uniref:Uncharacterized protein n=3 Tax=Diphasiastrum complanatum TaxID=34168 RepID=A0ACC2E2S5_DIPCM|nr:hypothetical protein O6H91_04G140300 [Diphasiastrum complanatum]KAJ7560681.1 hypothetical protein O6H91_04G140300 [Diphasiastrum complanatum]KAJ7560682.1 hypothetical protein O6H91_04G140300 [Diphasiastrum complanatum]
MEEVQQEQPTPSEKPIRSRPPGCKRLLVTLSVLISVVAGIPFWWKLTEVYRAPLPFTEIEEHARKASNTALGLPCQLQVIFAIPPENFDEAFWIDGLLQDLATSIHQQAKNIISKQHNGSDCCGSNIGVLVSLDAGEICRRHGQIENRMIWPCGLVQSGILESSFGSSDEVADELLWSFSRQSANSETQINSGWPVGRDGGLYTIVVLHNLGSDDRTNLRTVIGKHRHAWISGMNLKTPLRKEELTTLIANVGAIFLGADASMMGKVREGNSTVPDVAGESMPLAADGTAVLSFSLLNANPTDWIFMWDFEKVEELFLAPIIEAMAPFAQLTVESQVLYYTPKAIQSRWDAGQRTHIVASKDFPFFVNANEWHLDTSIAAAGRSKLLHFAIYIPAAQECPLHLKLASGRLSSTNGFTSPGWGGVIIWNPPSCKMEGKQAVQMISLQDLEPVVEVMIAQLRTLFGLPATSFTNKNKKIFGVPTLETGFAKWELDVLLRRRAYADIAASTSTLASLSRLVQSLPNMVIKDEISDQVRSSLKAGATAHKNALLGAYMGTAEAARKARAWAEAAFFHPSIMSLLYFPTEHHFAIYTPFFVPVLLHTSVSVFKEVSRYFREREAFLRHKQRT